MATFLNITSRHYQDCEFGKVTPNATMPVQLADYFNVSTTISLDVLMTQQGIKKRHLLMS